MPTRKVESNEMHGRSQTNPKKSKAEQLKLCNCAKKPKKPKDFVNSSWSSDGRPPEIMQKIRKTPKTHGRSQKNPKTSKAAQLKLRNCPKKPKKPKDFVNSCIYWMT